MTNDDRKESSTLSQTESLSTVGTATMSPRNYGSVGPSEEEEEDGPPKASPSSPATSPASERSTAAAGARGHGRGR
ncbi:hypothetical protein THAOC_07959, partial [Thalassiosira oceanica]